MTSDQVVVITLFEKSANMCIGLKPKNLFGGEDNESAQGLESPYGSVNSSFSTPCMEKSYPLNPSYQNNDGSKCREVNEYINAVIKSGDQGDKQFVNYQYDNNLFSPFNAFGSSNREPLGDILSERCINKLAYTDCVKDNRKDFSFVYNDKRTKDTHRDHMIFSTFNQANNDIYSVCSPIIMPPSPIKSENFEKFNGRKMLFKDEPAENESVKYDSKWILDILGEDKESPTKPIDNVSDQGEKDVSSKAHLKSIFSNAKFTVPKSAVSTQQVAMKTIRKINFDNFKNPPTAKRLNFGAEPRREQIVNPAEARIYTPAPMKTIRKCLSDTYNKQTVTEVSRRLKDELIENPNSPSKVKCKEFSENMKKWESAGFASTMKKVFDQISTLPKKVHWKILVELAEFAKRENEFSEAATLYKIITHIQPYAHPGWLENSKMEEELGNINRCRTLLKRGLYFSPTNENLFLRSLKIEEREGNYQEVKKLIGTLKNHKIEDTYKLLLEAALFEGRCGNVKIAQKAMKFLCKRCCMFGQVFISAASFEERIGNIDTAIKICQEGLESNCSYGPLWLLMIKLGWIACQKHNFSQNGSNFAFKFANPNGGHSVFNGFDELFEEAIRCVSQELRPKLYLEVAQYQEKVEDITNARKYLKDAVFNCTSKLRWRVWIIGARIEARIGNKDSAKMLIERALLEIPPKKQSIAFLEYAKFYELIGNMNKSQKILCFARKSVETDWKIFFESVLTYLRNGNFDEAEKLVKISLKKHSVTGRLWATLIQLKHAKVTQDYEQSVQNSSEAKQNSIPNRNSIKVHKDHINNNSQSNCSTSPTSRNSLLMKKAYSVFLLAIRKIPKSGEVWCEGARLLMSPVSHKYDLKKAEKYLNFAIQFTPQYGDSFLELFKLYTLRGETEKIEKLKNVCMHSEPNYGILWFYFKYNINDTALEIWNNATAVMTTPQTTADEKSEYWTGYNALNKLYRQGVGNSELDNQEKWRNIYGFEQIVG